MTGQNIRYSGVNCALGPSKYVCYRGDFVIAGFIIIIIIINNNNNNNNNSKVFVSAFKILNALTARYIAGFVST